MELVMYLLAVYGLTNIIVNESVFRKQIDWIKSKSQFLNDVLSCPTCLAFYIGVGLFLLTSHTLSGILLIDLLLAGLASSGVVNLIEHIKIKFGE